MLAPILFAVLSLGAADVAEAPRLLVLDLDAANMPADEARAIDAIVVANARVDGVVLVTQRELQKLAELDAAAQQAGCDTSSCLAEIAGALGARYVLFGSASRLGQSVTVSLSMFDVSTSVTTRDAVTVASIDELPARLPPRVTALVNGARGGATVAASTGASPLSIAGMVTTIVGGAAVGGGVGVAGIADFGVVRDRTASGANKRTAQTAGIAGLIGAGAGVVVTAVGVTLLVIGGGE